MEVLEQELTVLLSCFLLIGAMNCLLMLMVLVLLRPFHLLKNHLSVPPHFWNKILLYCKYFLFLKALVLPALLTLRMTKWTGQKWDPVNTNKYRTEKTA